MAATTLFHVVVATFSSCLSSIVFTVFLQHLPLVPQAVQHSTADCDDDAIVAEASVVAQKTAEVPQVPSMPEVEDVHTVLQWQRRWHRELWKYRRCLRWPSLRQPGRVVFKLGWEAPPSVESRDLNVFGGLFGGACWWLSLVWAWCFSGRCVWSGFLLPCCSLLSLSCWVVGRLSVCVCVRFTGVVGRVGGSGALCCRPVLLSGLVVWPSRSGRVLGLSFLLVSEKERRPKDRSLARYPNYAVCLAVVLAGGEKDFSYGTCRFPIAVSLFSFRVPFSSSRCGKPRKYRRRL